MEITVYRVIDATKEGELCTPGQNYTLTVGSPTP